MRDKLGNPYQEGDYMLYATARNAVVRFRFARVLKVESHRMRIRVEGYGTDQTVDSWIRRPERGVIVSGLDVPNAFKQACE